MSRNARAGLALLAVGLGATACGPLGLPGDLTPLTGQTHALAPVPIEPLWRAELTLGPITRETPHHLAGAAHHPRRDLLGIAGHDGKVHCLDAASGVVRWRVQGKGPGSGRAVFDGDQLIVGTENGTLTAYNVHDGAELWTYAVQGAISQAPVIAGDRLVFADGTNAVYALERGTGAWRWQYRRPEIPATFALVGEAPPSVYGDRVYVGFSDGILASLRLDSGGVAWTRDLAPEHDRFQDVDARAVLAGNTLVAASVAGGLYGLDPQTGEVRWQQPRAGITGLIEVDGDVVSTADRGEIMRFSPRDGAGRWRTRFGAKDGAPGDPVQIGNLLAVAISKGGLHFLDAATGRPIQQFTPGNGIHAPPVAGKDGSIYLLSDGGILYALRPRRS